MKLRLYELRLAGAEISYSVGVWKFEHGVISLLDGPI